jgi:hypothetical protein
MVELIGDQLVGASADKKLEANPIAISPLRFDVRAGRGLDVCEQRLIHRRAMSIDRISPLSRATIGRRCQNDGISPKLPLAKSFDRLGDVLKNGAKRVHLEASHRGLVQRIAQDVLCHLDAAGSHEISGLPELAPGRKPRLGMPSARMKSLDQAIRGSSNIIPRIHTRLRVVLVDNLALVHVGRA